MRKLLILLAFLMPLCCFSQLKLRSLSINFGPAAYAGDLSHNYKTWTPFVGIRSHFQSGKWLERSIELKFGKIQSESIRPVQGLNFFETNYINASFLFQYQIELISGFSILGGVAPGLILFSVRDESGNVITELPLGKFPEENYRNLTISVEPQLEANFALTKNNILYFGTAFLLPLSDYLDNTSQAVNDVNRDNIMRFVAGYRFLLP